MGRTVPTYRRTLESAALRFSAFRRALREGDRRAFDRLIDRARAHSSAASYEASLDPNEVFLLSILLDHELEVARLERAVEELSWAVLGRPAASSGTLDAFVKTKGNVGEGGPRVEGLKVKDDEVDKTDGALNFRFKEDGRRTPRDPDPRETTGSLEPL